MFNTYKLKIWLNWPSVRAHMCTTAVALSFNSTWRVPRDAFRYGAVSYGIVFTVAMIAVALPTSLLQLAIGQLSQQDAVGVWRAVPFFRGVGYLRLLISFLASIYTVSYVAMTATNFFHSLNNTILFWDCSTVLTTQVSNETYVYNMSTCANETILAPVQEQPENYIAMALVTLVLWLLAPIVLYNPVKLLKKLFYCATPVVFVLAIIVLSCIGNKNDISLMNSATDWINFSQVKIWHSAITQALWSTQIAGGYLIPVGDTLYSSTDVQWTTVVFVSFNLLAGWLGLIFWYGIGGQGERDSSVLAVLVQTHKVVREKSLTKTWPLIIFALLFASGTITVLTLLYPLYDRFKRIGGCKWRYLAVGSSLVGAGLAMAALAVGLPAFTILEDIVVPFLVCITTVLEICPFIFIYGWRVLIEDIEFLVGRKLTKYWLWGWCAVIGIIVTFNVWWLVVYFLEPRWVDPPWEASGLVTTAAAALAVFVLFAGISVARQVQYDVLGKLKSSFRPSRHWGPRDPITHYYWLARRDDMERNQTSTRYYRRQLGQFSGHSSFLNINNNLDNNNKHEIQTDNKKRSYSDDWLYAYRKQYLVEMNQENTAASRKRSKSLDWAVISNLRHRNGGCNKQLNTESNVTSHESVVTVKNTNSVIRHL